MNIKDVKQEFIEKGRQVLSYELDSAVGNKLELNPGEINIKGHSRIIDTMLELIKADTDILKIQVKNTADILAAISKGQISISDAKEMVSLIAMINGEVGSSEDTNRLIIEIASGREVVKVETVEEEK